MAAEAPYADLPDFDPEEKNDDLHQFSLLPPNVEKIVHRIYNMILVAQTIATFAAFAAANAPENYIEIWQVYIMSAVHQILVCGALVKLSYILHKEAKHFGVPLSSYEKIKAIVLAIGATFSASFALWFDAYSLNGGECCFENITTLLQRVLVIVRIILMLEVLLIPRITSMVLSASTKLWIILPLVLSFFFSMFAYFSEVMLDRTSDIMCKFKSLGEPYVPFILIGMIMGFLFLIEVFCFLLGLMHPNPVLVLLFSGMGCIVDEPEPHEENRSLPTSSNSMYAPGNINDKHRTLHESKVPTNVDSKGPSRVNTVTKTKTDSVTNFPWWFFVIFGPNQAAAAIVFSSLSGRDISWIYILPSVFACCVVGGALYLEVNKRKTIWHVSNTTVRLIVPYISAMSALILGLVARWEEYQSLKFILSNIFLEIVLISILFIYLWVRGEKATCDRYSKLVAPTLLLVWVVNFSEEIRHYEEEVLNCESHSENHHEHGEDHHEDGNEELHNLSFIMFSFVVEFFWISMEEVLGLLEYQHQIDHHYTNSHISQNGKQDSKGNDIQLRDISLGFAIILSMFMTSYEIEYLIFIDDSQATVLPSEIDSEDAKVSSGKDKKEKSKRRRIHEEDPSVRSVAIPSVLTAGKFSDETEQMSEARGEETPIETKDEAKEDAGNL